MINLLVGAASLAYGIYLCWSAYDTHKKIVASKDWPVTSGKVTAAEIKVSHGGKGGSSYHPEITYRYSVNGTEFTRGIRKNKAIFRFIAEDFLKLLPIGTSIRVSYDPENPMDCVSNYDEEGIPWLGLIAIAFGVMFIWSAFQPGGVSTGGNH